MDRLSHEDLGLLIEILTRLKKAHEITLSHASTSPEERRRLSAEIAVIGRLLGPITMTYTGSGTAERPPR